MQQHAGIQSATKPHQQRCFRCLIQCLFQAGRVCCAHAYMLAGADDSGTELLHARWARLNPSYFLDYQVLCHLALGADFFGFGAGKSCAVVTSSDFSASESSRSSSATG